MSTTTASMHLMRCPACDNDIVAAVTYTVDFGDPRPVKSSIEATVTVTAKVSGAKIVHDCRDGKPVPTQYLEAVAK